MGSYRRLAGAVVYYIVHKASGRIYIGSTINRGKRWNEHSCSLRRGDHHSSFLQRSWNKYGPEEHLFGVLEFVSDLSRLIEREQFYLERYQPEFNSRFSAESTLGRPMSREHRQKISAALTRRKATLEQIENFRRAKTGVPQIKQMKPLSPKRLAILHTAIQKREAAGNGRKGISLSAETKEKLSKARKGKPLSPDHIRAIVLGRERKKADPNFVPVTQDPEYYKRKQRERLLRKRTERLKLLGTDNPWVYQ